jgi:hypothetical protein
MPKPLNLFGLLLFLLVISCTPIQNTPPLDDENGTKTAVMTAPQPLPTLSPTTPPQPTVPAPATLPPQPTTAATATPAIGFYPPAGRQFATLDEFWDGEAEWLLEIHDVGLPIGESETVYKGDNLLWSYLHASYQSAGVHDQCGDPVEFPGCTTLWTSTDGGRSFQLEEPVCLFPCESCPCDHRRDHVGQQQYPRVFFAHDLAYLVYEFGAYNYLRVSLDGLNWSSPEHVPGTWIWTWPYGPCRDQEIIFPHPHIHYELDYNCLAGGPPGIFIDEDDMLYVFVALGQAPGHMGCFKGNRYADISAMQPCDTPYLFKADIDYGPIDVLGPAANPYFEFRTISSAAVVKVGNRFYMTYEGIRGPSSFTVVDDQFALGLARSSGPDIDGRWEKYPGNPIIMDLPGNVGVGHADFLIVGEATYLYTTTPEGTRGRYVLLRRDQR